MYEEREAVKAEIIEARLDWINTGGRKRMEKQHEAARMKIVALVEELQTLNGRRPASVERPSPVVASSAWMGDGEALKAEMARAYDEWWEDTMSGCWEKEVYRVGFIGGYLAGRRAHDAMSPIAGDERRGDDSTKTTDPMPQETDPNTQDRVRSMPCSAHALVRLTDLRITKCVDKDALQDAIRAYKKRSITYIPLRWHVGAQTWVALEVCE